MIANILIKVISPFLFLEFFTLHYSIHWCTKAWIDECTAYKHSY